MESTLSVSVTTLAGFNWELKLIVIVEVTGTPVADLTGEVVVTLGATTLVVADVVKLLVKVATALPERSVKPLTCTV